MVLQAAIAVIGIAVFAFLLWEPTSEGRNAHATLFQVYFNDPFLACAYVAAIPFFVALVQAFTLLGEAGRGGAFSTGALRALRRIRNCALIVIGFVAVGEVCLFLRLNGEDDIAGGVAMGALVFLLCAAIAAAASLFARSLQRRILA